MLRTMMQKEVDPYVKKLMKRGWTLRRITEIEKYWQRLRPAPILYVESSDRVPGIVTLRDRIIPLMGHVKSPAYYRVQLSLPAGALTKAIMRHEARHIDLLFAMAKRYPNVLKKQVNGSRLVDIRAFDEALWKFVTSDSKYGEKLKKLRKSIGSELLFSMKNEQRMLNPFYSLNEIATHALEPVNSKSRKTAEILFGLLVKEYKLEHIQKYSILHPLIAHYSVLCEKFCYKEGGTKIDRMIPSSDRGLYNIFKEIYRSL